MFRGSDNLLSNFAKCKHLIITCVTSCLGTKLISGHINLYIQLQWKKDKVKHG